MNEDLDMLFNREANNIYYINPGSSKPLADLSLFEVLLQELIPIRS